jgi:hypothetical protein
MPRKAPDSYARFSLRFVNHENMAELWDRMRSYLALAVNEPNRLSVISACMHAPTMRVWVSVSVRDMWPQ